MAHGIECFPRVPPDVPGSVFSLISGVTIVLLLTSRPVGSVDINSTTIITEYMCGKCSASNCIEVTDCITVCGGCEAPMYKLHLIYNPFCVESREKRQVPLAESTPSTTTTPATTTVKNAWICKNCSVVGCNKCIELVETPSCEVCQAGYRLNNVTKTCYTELEEGLSGVAIAGIVIAVVCIVGITIVIVLFVRRRFRGSRDVSARNQRMQPVVNAGGSVSSKMPQIPKINTKELLRKHDQITRYMKDPTSKDSPKNNKKNVSRASQEHKELQELGEAPPPPAESNDYTDMHHKYDPLDTKNQNEPQLYLPMQHEEDALYLNTAAVENEFRQAQGLYENTQQASHQAVNQAKSPNGNTTKHPALAKSQESIDYYEPVGTSSSAQETQEVYENNDSAVLVKKNAAETDDIYLNENVDNVYQNA